MDAHDDGWSRWEVCDEDSADLEEIYGALMDEDGVLRPEFDAKVPIDFVMVLDGGCSMTCSFAVRSTCLPRFCRHFGPSCLHVT